MEGRHGGRTGAETEHSHPQRRHRKQKDELETEWTLKACPQWPIFSSKFAPPRVSRTFPNSATNWPTVPMNLIQPSQVSCCRGSTFSCNNGLLRIIDLLFCSLKLVLSLGSFILYCFGGRKPFKRQNKRGWEDSWIDKVLALQVVGPELDPLSP